MSEPVWDLSDLYAGVADPQLKKDLAAYAAAAKSFNKKWAGKLANANKNGKLKTAIAEYEKLGVLSYKPSYYSMFGYDINQANPLYKKMQGDVADELTAANQQILFFRVELTELEKIDLAKLGEYRPWVEDLLADADHRLSLELESWIADNGSVDAYWGNLRDILVGRMRFDIAGKKNLTLEEATTLQASNPNRSVRKEAYTKINAAFENEKPIFTLLMNTVTKSNEIGARWRKYADLDESRHIANRIEPAVVETMAKTIKSCYADTSHRYFKLKRKIMGVTALEPWDRLAPLPGKTERKIPWDEAVEKVVQCYTELDADMGAMARRFFDEGWVDAKIREGKSGGGYCAATVAEHHPYILVNYKGTPNCVAVLAHEMGHGIHDMLAAQNNNNLTMHPPLTLAETASVFGEMLCFQMLLAETEDPKEKRALLAEKVETMLNTVVRQNAFYEFEKAVHAERRDNGELTADTIGEIWSGIMRESLGPACSSPDSTGIGWAAVSHFMNSPFYVYAYSFGDGLVNSLWQVREKGEVDDFTGKFKDLLAAGGSKKYDELLQPFGLDASQPKFWRAGMKMIAGFIDEIEKIKV